MSGLKLGVSQQQQCNYLPDRQERLLFTLPEEPLDATFYQQLLTLNFRRSGEQIYTTYCEGCQQCQSGFFASGVSMVRVAGQQLVHDPHQTW